MEDSKPPDLKKKIKKYFSLTEYVSKVITNDMGYSPRGRLSDLLQTSQILLMAKREINRIPKQNYNWNLKHCSERIEEQNKSINTLMGQLEFNIQRERVLVYS